MFITSSRWNALRLAAGVFAGLFLTVGLTAQVALSSSPYNQTFDTLGSGLPAGWTVYTGATATGLGTPATVNTATTVSWAATTGQFVNLASADNNGAPFTGAEAIAVQSAATDRALAIRQTGAFGDPGASFNFNFSTVGRQVTSISFLAQMLSVQTRSTVWTVQYGIGATPATWTTLTTFSDPGVFGSTTINLSGFGTALDNQSNVWPRVVALAASTGAGSRDSFGLDDFTIVTTAGSGPTPPSIGTPPAAQSVTEGATVQFSVVASGTAPLSYQWRKNTTSLSDGGIVAGALTDTLTLTGVSLGDTGGYDVVVTNAAGSATSAAASLTVNPVLVAPGITTQPTAQAAPLGGSATFSVAASGTAPLAYQWRKGGAPLADGGNISGANAASLTINPVGAGDVASYDVVVSNAAPTTATSNAVALTLAAFVTPSGQVSYTGGSYLQNFDTLPASGTFTLTDNGPLALNAAPIGASGLGGWTFAKYDGTGTVALFRVDAGTGTSGAIYSYGTGTAPDRALGSLASGTTISRFGTTLINSTGLPISEFTLSYTGEEWRGGTGTNVLAVEYALDATDINTGTFVAAPALSFHAPTATTGALVGNNAPNRTAVSATVTGLTWAPGQTLVLRWTDVNDGGNDDGLAIDDLSLSTPVATGAILPSVVYTTPANGKANIPVNSPVSLTFNEAVNFTSSAVTVTGDVSGPHAVAVTGGPVSYTVTPTTSFAEGETVTLTVAAAQVTDATTGSVHPGGDFTMSFETFSSSPLPIHKIQGSGTASAYAGYAVTVQGIVVGSFQGAGQIGGYYIEEPDALQDANPATSEGIYVFDNTNSVAVGDLVTVTRHRFPSLATRPSVRRKFPGSRSSTRSAAAIRCPRPWRLHCLSPASVMPSATRACW